MCAARSARSTAFTRCTGSRTRGAARRRAVAAGTPFDVNFLRVDAVERRIQQVAHSARGGAAAVGWGLAGQLGQGSLRLAQPLAPRGQGFPGALRGLLVTLGLCPL